MSERVSLNEQRSAIDYLIVIGPIRPYVASATAPSRRLSAAGADALFDDTRREEGGLQTPTPHPLPPSCFSCYSALPSRPHVQFVPFLCSLSSSLPLPPSPSLPFRRPSSRRTASASKR